MTASSREQMSQASPITPGVDQSRIFAAEEADNYFRRNRTKRGFLVEHLLDLFPRAALAGYDVAEWGIGGGQNLALLSHFVRRAHGYDVSAEAIASFEGYYRESPDREKFHAQQVNLCEPFTTPVQYDLVIYGFFAYYVSDAELAQARTNLLNALKPGGYLFVYDFLTRVATSAPDARNPRLRVYKRNLPFWLDHLEPFDLIDFRLFDNEKVLAYRMRDSQAPIDPGVPSDDREWNFGGLWRRRPS